MKAYDYAKPDAYFVTIVTQGRVHRFGEIVDGVVRLSDAGRMVDYWIDELHEHFSSVSLDVSVVMPNHVHFVVVIADPVGADRCVRPSVPASQRARPGEPRGTHIGVPLQGDALPTIVQWFKTMTTNAYIRGVANHVWSSFDSRLWQRNYYEHVIRDERELDALRDYVTDNPVGWQNDCERHAL